MQEIDARAVYCKPRNQIVANHRDNENLSIKREWSLCIVRWLEHVLRHPTWPASLLVRAQDDLWLQTLRFLHVRASKYDSYSSGETGTRSCPGFPFRWSDKWLPVLQEATGLENPGKTKALTRKQGALVETILEFGKLHGVCIG